MTFWEDDISMGFNGDYYINFGVTGTDNTYASEQSIWPGTSGGNIGTSSHYWWNGYFYKLWYNQYATFSDRSTKQNIKSLVENRSNSINLDKVLALNPVKFDCNLDTHPFYKDVELKEGQLEESKDNLGFIAQELMEVIPEMVAFSKDYQLYTIKNYEQMFPVLVGAIQEMKAENDDLKSRIERLEASNGE